MTALCRCCHQPSVVRRSWLHLAAGSSWTRATWRSGATGHRGLAHDVHFRRKLDRHSTQTVRLRPKYRYTTYNTGIHPIQVYIQCRYIHTIQVYTYNTGIHTIQVYLQVYIQWYTYNTQVCIRCKKKWNEFCGAWSGTDYKNLFRSFSRKQNSWYQYCHCIMYIHPVFQRTPQPPPNKQQCWLKRKTLTLTVAKYSFAHPCSIPGKMISLSYSIL